MYCRVLNPSIQGVPKLGSERLQKIISHLKTKDKTMCNVMSLIAYFSVCTLKCQSENIKINKQIAI